MGKIFERVRQYPWVVAASVVGILGLALQGSVEGVLSQWLVSIFVAIVAAHQGIHMVRSLLKKQWGLDVLAVN